MTDAMENAVRARWSRGDIVALVALMGVAVAATWDAWFDIFWLALRDEEQSHILLVPVVAAWLIWIRRGRLRRCARDHRWVGPLVVALGWALYSLGDLREVLSAWHLGAIVVAIGCFLSFSGARYVTRLFPAFFVLAFLVPIPGTIRQQIGLPLQQATAEATRRVLGVLGVEAARSGNALTINGTEVLVAEACNGLRMVFALFLVSYTFAYGSPIVQPVRLLIVLLSPLTAIVCNVIRLVPTLWVYGYVSKPAGEFMHDIGNWVMLPVAFLILFGVFRAMRWALVPVYRFTLAYGR